MSYKIKLTVEQMDAINLGVNEYGKERLMDSGILGPREYPLKGLNDIRLSELARILYEPDSYEVEEQFKVGDWVYHECNKTVNEIERIDEDVICVKGGHDFKAEFRHATPEEINQEQERRVWRKMNRQPGEIKKGDIGVNRNGLMEGVARDIKESYEHGDLIALYPVESRISLIAGESDE